MNKFYNEYGAMNEEANKIIAELENAIIPIIKKYEDDIETIIFFNIALTYMHSVVCEYILRYGFKKHKENKKEK